MLYRKTNEPFAPYSKITVSPEDRMKEIYGLKKFTYYTIRVLAFTIKGDGAQSPPVNVSTDEDSKYMILWTTFYNGININKFQDAPLNI